VTRYPLRGSRLPSNDAEAAFYRWAKNEGWVVSKRGWPDFNCYRGKDFMVVEVKRRRGDNPLKHQAQVMTALQELGVPCHLWSPDGGLRPLGSSAEGVLREENLRWDGDYLRYLVARLMAACIDIGHGKAKRAEGNLRDLVKEVLTIDMIEGRLAFPVPMKGTRRRAHRPDLSTAQPVVQGPVGGLEGELVPGDVGDGEPAGLHHLAPDADATPGLAMG